MSLTRFYDRQSGRCGPVIGALQSFSVEFANIVAAETDEQVMLQLPAGATFEISDVSSFTGAIGAAGVTFSVGTTTGGEEVVANVAMVAGVMNHTIVEGTVGPATLVYVTLTGGASTGTAAAPIVVTITGYISTPPTSVLR